jgi:large conductance mechanosensitive channel
MGLISDFKSFALKGNVMDLAVGVIIGAAFGKIVAAVVEDLLMPVIGMVAPSGKMFSDQFVVLKAGKDGDVYHSLDEAKKAGANIFAYGHFVQTVFDFLIIALCVFMMIKALEKMKRKSEAAAAAPAAPAPPTATETLLAEIRDELRKK